jgi:hypothetical protein
MKKLFTYFLGLLLFQISTAQNTDNYWLLSSDKNVQPKAKRQIIPQKYNVYRLNTVQLKKILFAAPNEKLVKISESNCIITLPLPNKTFQKFRVVEASIMEQGLATQFPNIRTFSVKGIDDPYANGKLDWNEFGFHGMIRTVNEGDFFIDPYCLENTTDYITYYTKDFVKDPSQIIPEVGVNKPKDSIKPNPTKKKEEEAEVSSLFPATCVGAQLRTYRLAVACTHQYAIAATGLALPTIAQTLSRIVTTVNRVDGVYETEVAVRLVLVATETLIIFTSAASDPFTGNNNANVLIGESQTIITNTIGVSNFDIGHTFSTGGGGLADLGCVCVNSQKANGITGSPNPAGDPFDIDYVAHEVGHQFGADHTFNATTGGCGGGNRNPGTAVEPGSGITIMAYAGLCGTNDLATTSIAYFHAISYDDIVNFTQIFSGNNCAVTSTTGNNPPVVTGSGNYIIPKSTPFVLTGSATDIDGDALTFSWEETDLGTDGNWNSSNKPFFRSYAPFTTPTRLFPIQSVVSSGNYTITRGEFVPTSAQNLEFRLTARDNKMGGGGVCYAINTITVSNAGPLIVTYPNLSGINWAMGASQAITWGVNGTDIAPVSCDSVRILISYNSGTTYSILINSTPNDGSELLTAPTLSANIATCRIKVESKGNIFYDISNNDFTISNNVGIKAQSQNNSLGLSVWPNPFTNQFNLTALNLNSESSTQLKIVDVLGKVVYQTNYQKKSELHETIDLSTISNGVYFIAITNNAKQSFYRIVKN